MRNYMLTAVTALFAVSLAFAQGGADQMKTAGKAFSSYKTSNDAVKLQEALDAVQIGMEDPAVQADYESYIDAGDIYSAAIQQYVTDRSLAADEEIEPMVARAASQAAEFYMKAYNMSEKKGGKRDALQGLENLQGNLSNEGIYAITDQQYEDSYYAYNTSVSVDKFLRDNGGTSIFADDETKLNDERYYAALSAVLFEDYDASEPLFLALYEGGYDDVGLYDGLYKVYNAKGDTESAAKYLEEGRQKYPEETSLLFTEINYYLAEGRLDELTGKLEQAIVAEPDNVSLYATLGSVYEQLYKSSSTEDVDKAEEYFGKAKENYEAGLEKEPENATLIYSLGALYFNRAATMTAELVELGNDLSKDGQKKYEAMEEQINNQFDIAYPYFQKAEMTDPGNRNTLIALKEIFARRDNYDASTEMKERIEKLEAGETIDKSYFKENGM